MKRYQAHLALAHLIGDPIEVAGSPVVTIPDGVRYSRRFRDICLYRAMLGFLDDINKQTAQLPTPEADQVWMKILPTYHKEESLGPVTFDGEILPLTRSVVRINAVYHGAFNGGHAFRQSPARLSMNRRNVTNRNEHDPLYTLVNNGTDPAALRFDIPTGFLSNWSTENVYCHYVPVPTNPEDQSPEDTLDFEPMYYNSIISKAMMLVNVGSQDYQQAETMQLLTGAN